MYTASFLSNPLQFMRVNTVSPPDGMYGTLIKSWTVPNEGNIASGHNDETASSVEYRDGGPRVKFARFAPHGQFPNTLTLDLSEAPGDADRIPIHWLPWSSLRIIKTQIPEVPRNQVEADENENPRFFFTAGINGCSIFVKGPPTKPTLFHGGITGKLSRDAAGFWREQLEIATRGTHLGRETTWGEVHKHEYMDAESRAMKDYFEWLHTGGSTSTSFTLEVLNCFGCVFGIRYGHYWSFYVQESALIEKVRFVKSRDIASSRSGTGPEQFTEKHTGLKATQNIVTTPRSLGIIPLPARTTKTYAVAEQHCSTVRVAEIYPNRHWSGQLTDILTARRL
jgi:hypothetical protein